MFLAVGSHVLLSSSLGRGGGRSFLWIIRCFKKILRWTREGPREGAIPPNLYWACLSVPTTCEREFLPVKLPRWPRLKVAVLPGRRERLAT